MRLSERFRILLLEQEAIISNSISKIDLVKASSAQACLTGILKVHILNMAVLFEVCIVHINLILMYHSITEKGGSPNTLALQQIMITVHPHQLVHEQCYTFKKLSRLIQLYTALS
jgi:hypothetical protein